MSKTPPGQVNPSFIELDTLRSADGLVAIISQRKSNGAFTVAVMKEFERDGEKTRSAFIPEALFTSFRAMFDLALERIGELKRAQVAQVNHVGARK